MLAVKLPFMSAGIRAAQQPRLGADGFRSVGCPRSEVAQPACLFGSDSSDDALSCRWERGSVTCCCLTRWFVRAAVKPECPGLYRADPEQSGRRPGICGNTCPYLVLICGLDGMQGLLTVTNWAAENDKAIVDEPIHECRVPGPALLVPDLTRGVPAWTVDQSHREIGHDRSVRAIADIRGCSCAAARQPSERPGSRV